MTSPYESFFGLLERPFSLTPDPRFFFKSRAHGRALDALSFGLRRREQFLLVTGDGGVGKTVLCHALVERLRHKGPVSFVPNPLLTPGGLYRLLLEDFGAVTREDLQQLQARGSTLGDLRDRLVMFLAARHGQPEAAVIVVDEAHSMPAILGGELLSLATPDTASDHLLQIVLVGQSAPGGTNGSGISALDERVSTRTGLAALSRDECADYVAHRLRTGGSPTTVAFSRRAVDVLHDLSDGVPRLINLIAERALQESGRARSHTIEAAMVEAAAAALDLARTRPRRFRWFSKRVS
jgi:general secretion pathway protein A